MRRWAARRVIVVRGVLIASAAAAVALSHTPTPTVSVPVIPPIVLPSIPPFPTFSPPPGLDLGGADSSRPLTLAQVLPPLGHERDGVPTLSGRLVACGTTGSAAQGCKEAAQGRCAYGDVAVDVLVVGYADHAHGAARRAAAASAPALRAARIPTAEVAGRFVVVAAVPPQQATDTAARSARDTVLGTVETRLRLRI